MPGGCRAVKSTLDSPRPPETEGQVDARLEHERPVGRKDGAPTDPGQGVRAEVGPGAGFSVAGSDREHLAYVVGTEADGASSLTAVG